MDAVTHTIVEVQYADQPEGVLLKQCLEHGPECKATTQARRRGVKTDARELLAKHEEHGPGCLATAEAWAFRYTHDVKRLLELIEKMEGIEGKDSTYAHRIQSDFQSMPVDDEDEDVLWEYVPTREVLGWVTDVLFEELPGRTFTWTKDDGTEVNARLEWQKSRPVDPHTGPM